MNKQRRKRPEEASALLEQAKEILEEVKDEEEEAYENLHFNQGNDCDSCVHKYMYQGDVEACDRWDEGLDCWYQEREVRTCPTCGKEVYRDEMQYTKDCHGITFRLVCWDCYNRLMAKGYDGEYYDEADEQIEDDY